MPPSDVSAFSGELSALKALSAALGRDRRRTQAAGGNTSLKHDGILWVKASGTWLSEAEDKDIFVPVRIAPLMEALRTGDPRAEKATDFVAAELSDSPLRPSIETSVHAAIPQAVVLHIHCVETIALAVRTDGEARIRERLQAAGLAERFAHVPYCRPGVPLSREIARVAGPTIDVIVLENHGLVVAGQSVAEAAERLESVVAALATPPRDTPGDAPADAQGGSGAEPDLAELSALAEGTPYRLPADATAHRIARDPAARRVALAGPLYPDHVIFLGEAVGHVEASREAVRAFVAGAGAGRASAPPLLLVDGLGVLVRQTVTASGEALVGCLADVSARIPEDAPLKPFTAAELYALTHWEAESYRQSLDRPPAGGAGGSGAPGSAP
ncbi:class II aldolase/adducin family protein [Aurantimonas sp. 22II-16-19i]|uniref:class II aldolase/adducin family protein n=1 Tax=Aurantimonas sp. 22II-16-19i TaxID=1317114 RepID=UPI0009F9A27D|nr:class II aldolase/adducin family protein [Aurantimonas sp. 22II-16-19i]